MATKSQKAAERTAKAAAAREAQAKAERRRRLLTIGGVILVMVLIVGGAVLVSVLNQEEVDADSAGSEYGVTIGESDAPHEIVIYEDFLCPFCGELEAATADELERLADEGKVRVEYRPFDLLSSAYGDYPIRAANAFAVVLEEEGPETAKEMHDLLFANQPAEGGDYPSDDELVELAVEAGADEDAVRPGIEDLEMQDWVEDATDAAQEAGVGSTPTVILDGEQFTEGRTVEDLAASLIQAVE